MARYDYLNPNISYDNKSALIILSQLFEFSLKLYDQFGWGYHRGKNENNEYI